MIDPQIARLCAALQAIADLGPTCADCEEMDGEDIVPASPRKPVTHVTKFNWVLDVHLCAEHAVTRAASLAKAESKGCGKQPTVELYVETNEAVILARAALS